MPAVIKIDKTPCLKCSSAVFGRPETFEKKCAMCDARTDYIRQTKHDIPTKICGICKVEKALDKTFFSIDNQRAGGFRGNCKKCDNEARAESKARSKAKYKAKKKLALPVLPPIPETGLKIKDALLLPRGANPVSDAFFDVEGPLIKVYPPIELLESDEISIAAGVNDPLPLAEGGRGIVESVPDDIFGPKNFVSHESEAWPAHIRQSTNRTRPKALSGTTYQITAGCGDLYVTINSDTDGPLELFLTIGKAGGCASAQNQAIGRLVSLAWRKGCDSAEVIKELGGIACHAPAGVGNERVLSCADAVALAIKNHIGEE